MSARSIAHVLFRHKRLFLSVLAVFLLAGAVAAAVWQPRFQAEAALRAPAGEAPIVVALLESRALHDAVTATLGEELFPLKPHSLHGDRFGAGLTVAVDGSGDLVRVGFEARDPDLAVRALTALVAQARLHGEVAQPAAQGESVASRQARLEGVRAAAHTKVRALETALGELNRQLAATPRTLRLSAQSEPSAVVEKARAKVFDLQTKEQELLGTYTEGSVFIERIRAERRRAEQLLAGLVAQENTRVMEGANPMRQDLERRILETQAALTEARIRAGTADAELGAFERSAEGRPADSAADTIALVQPAAASSRPLGAGRAEILALAALAGLIFALLAASLAQRLSSTFSTPGEAESRLGLPVLTTFPRER